MADPTTVKHVVGSASDDDSAFWSNNPRGIPLQALFGANKGSGEIGMRLKAHDVSGDGYLDKTEFRNAISNEIAAVKSTKQLKLIVLVLAALVVAICGVMTGLTYAVVEMSKETGIASNGVMTKKGTNEAVQVAHATSHSKLTSKLPDEAFEQMEKLEVISPTGSRLVMNVLGWARVMDKDACEGNYVRLVTAEGKVKLDGSAMTFDAGVDSFFAEVGFATSASAGGMRRLASVFKIIAILNAVKDYANLDEECERKPGFHYASFTMEMDVSYPCPKKRNTNVDFQGNTLCVKYKEQKENGTWVVGSHLAGYSDGRIVHKERLEYDESAKVYASIKQYAEFPGFAHITIRNAQNVLSSGYQYQTEISGHGKTLKPSDAEVHKCSDSDPSDPVKPPAFSSKLGERVVDGRTLREFEFLYPIDNTSLAILLGKGDPEGFDKMAVYPPEEAESMLVLKDDGNYYTRFLYYDYKHTGAPHSFMIPQPGGHYVIFNVTYFAWGAQNADRWTLTGGISSDICKPDPEKTPENAVGIIPLAHAVYRKNPGLVLSMEQREAMNMNFNSSYSTTNKSNTNAGNSPMSRRVRRLIEVPHELTVSERMLGGRWQDDAGTVISRMQADDQIPSRRLLAHRPDFEIEFESDNIEFAAEAGLEWPEIEMKLQLTKKRDDDYKKPMDGVIYHEWEFSGGGLSFHHDIEGGSWALEGWQVSTGTKGDEKCAGWWKAKYCAGLTSEIEIVLGAGFAYTDFGGAHQKYATVFGQVEWKARACAGWCIYAGGSGRVTLYAAPWRHWGTGLNKMFPGMKFEAEASVGICVGGHDFSWEWDGEHDWVW